MKPILTTKPSVLLVACFTLAAPLPAQLTSRLSVEASAQYVSLEGDDLERTEAGPGFEGQLRAAVSPKFSVGLGYFRSTHTVRPERDARLTGPLIEARYEFSDWRGIHPFLAVRGVMVTRSQDQVPTHGAPFEENVSGFFAGAAAGVMARTTLPVDFLLSVSVSGVRFSAHDFNPDSDAAGSSIGARFGISVPLGRL